MAKQRKPKTKKIWTKAEAESCFKEHNQTETILKPNGNVKAEPPADGDECECDGCQTHLGELPSVEDNAAAAAPAKK